MNTALIHKLNIFLSKLWEAYHCGYFLIKTLKFNRFTRGNTFIYGIHSLNGILMPTDIDFRHTLDFDIFHKFVNQAHPFVKVGVIYRNKLRMIYTALL